MEKLRLSDVIAWIGGLDLPTLLGAAVTLGMIGLLLLVWRGRLAARDATERLAEAQMALAGRLSQFADSQVAAQGNLAERMQTQERLLMRTLDERLTQVSQRVSESLHKQAVDTANTMGDLKERLAIIGKAQENITKLSADVVSLQEVLSNKQARGAFGETQLADQVRNALPPSAYAFQATLGNGSRVDCLLTLPNPPGCIAIDSKFPLESYHALRNARDDRDRLEARRRFSADVLKHVNDIASKYIIPGETADSALMFLPSEAVYAELHAELPEVVEKSHRARVYIVSPTTLMATLHTIRAVLKDAQMREQAGLIQKEVAAMGDDVSRLDSRVAKLQQHFGQAEEDIRQIRISTEKVQKRAVKIQELDLDEIEAQDLPKIAQSGGE
ncbi:MAG: DNA recombination protein RmuC [Alphaproteobacteria bacterium]|nr:DNA recombination protein RmuC [Alphaproteobacteria bacterium]